MQLNIAELLPKAEGVEQNKRSIVLIINGVRWSFPKEEYKEHTVDSHKTPKFRKSSRTRTLKGADQIGGGCRQDAQ